MAFWMGGLISCPTECEKKLVRLRFRSCWSRACCTLPVPKSGWGRAAWPCPVTYNEHVRVCPCPAAAPCCSFGAPGTAAWPRALPPGPRGCAEAAGALLQHQRAQPENIAGHCSRDCLAAIKPCQRRYKAFLKSSKAISTFFALPPPQTVTAAVTKPTVKQTKPSRWGWEMLLMIFTRRGSEALAERSRSS